MIVKVINDICVEVLSDPEHDQRFKGKFIRQPNSVRRDVRLSYSLPLNEQGPKFVSDTAFMGNR